VLSADRDIVILQLRARKIHLLICWIGKADGNRAVSSRFNDGDSPNALSSVHLKPTKISVHNLDSTRSFYQSFLRLLHHPVLKMLLCYWTILVTCACCIAAATTKKQPYQHYPITGTHTGVNSKTGARPARRNIIELLTDNPQW
jgi:hypothetical protein